MDPYIGEIIMFAGNFAPKGWALCNGQTMQIRQYTTLYSIIGVQYGGDGKTNFNLPDLRGKAPIHQGTGHGLTPRTIGEIGGTPSVTLQVSEMPAHTHVPNAQVAQGVADPTNAVWTSTVGARGPLQYGPTPATPMSTQAIGIQGGSQPHNNMQPSVGINYIIALEGIFPPHS
ncbi:MAG: phage tail protein [Candidatus Pristimantibacillus sp.]